MTLSRKILTAVALSAPLLGFAAPTAIDLDGSFNLQSDPFVYESATVKHTTLQGTLNDVNDVAWYAFTGQAGQRFWADHDDANGDTLIDTVLSLFDSTGNLLAVGDQTDFDPGSYSNGDAVNSNGFLGEYILPSSGVYYLALTSFGNSANDADCSADGMLFQPTSGGFGGLTYSACSINFALANAGSAAGSFTVQVSLASGTGTAVPEPGTLPLAAVALAGLMVRRRKR